MPIDSNTLSYIESIQEDDEELDLSSIYFVKEDYEDLLKALEKHTHIKRINWRENQKHPLTDTSYIRINEILTNNKNKVHVMPQRLREIDKINFFSEQANSSNDFPINIEQAIGIENDEIQQQLRPAILDDSHESFIRSEIRQRLGITTPVIISEPANENIEEVARHFPDGAVNEAVSYSSQAASLPINWRDSFPFQIAAKKRGLIPPDEKGEFFFTDPDSFKSKFSNNPESSVPYRVIVNIPFYAGSTLSISEVIQTFENTGFGPDRETSNKKAANSLVFVVGVNMMESLEPERNIKVQRKLDDSINTICEVHRFGFYWRPRWLDSNEQEVSFEDMRNHYLELKKKNPVLAAKILENIEKVSIKMVPYREIREVLKSHIYTCELAKLFHKPTSDLPVYLGLFDPDMVSASHVFDTYTDLITNYKENHENRAPMVLTTGYRLPHLDAERHDSPLHALAVELDMAVRHATARYVKNGTYYPEPNILVLFDADRMSESFMEGASLHEPKEYTDSYEWPVFMEDLIQKRGIDPNEHFIFDISNSIITALPDRMRYELGKDTLKIFYGQFNISQQIVRWRISDLRYLIATAQSHALPEAWASRLLRSLPSSEWDSEEITTVNKSKKTKIKFKELRKTLEKALKAFFEQLDPLSILDNEDKKEAKPEIRRFAEILASYFEKLPLFLPDEQDDDAIQKRGAELVGIIRQTAHNKQEGILKRWKNEEIQTLILYILGKDIGERFIRAAFTAAKALAHLYKDKLNTQFSEITQGFLESFYEECSHRTKHIYASDLPFTETQRAILAGDYDPDNPSFSADELLEIGKFRLNGLHIAALVGDAKLVNYALKYVSATSDADGHVLPLHCAILYLINNGASETNSNDLPLITALVQNKTHFVKTDIGLTALGLALTRLANAGSVVKQCMIGWNDVPSFVLEHIESMARLASLRERQTPLLAMMNKLGKHDGYRGLEKYTPRSLFECEKHGFSFLEPGIIENRIVIGRQNGEELIQLEEIVTTTLAEAIRQDDIGTFSRVEGAYKKANMSISTDLVDRDGRPLAISAVVNTKHPSSWLSRLKALGIPLAVVDISDSSPILHEAIFPASARRLGGTARNMQRYFQGFKAYFEHITTGEKETIKKLFTINMLLKEPGIDPNERDTAGDRPLDIAIEMGYPYIAWTLIKAGARLFHLDNSQLERLVQLLGVLYAVKEIDKESFLIVMNKHPDSLKRIRTGWLKVINSYDNMMKNRLASISFFINMEDNYKILFQSISKYINNDIEAVPSLGLLGIDAYIELAFKLYLMNYKDVCHFYSFPIEQRLNNFKILYSTDMKFYQDLNALTSNYVDKIHKALTASDGKAKKPKLKKLSKKERKNQLKQKNLNSNQQRLETDLNILDPDEEMQGIQKNEIVEDLLDLAKGKTSLAEIESTIVSKETKQENLSIVGTAEIQDQEIAQQVFQRFMELFKCEEVVLEGRLPEDEIKKYILALIKIEEAYISSRNPSDSYEGKSGGSRTPGASNGSGYRQGTDLLYGQYKNKTFYFEQIPNTGIDRQCRSGSCGYIALENDRERVLEVLNNKLEEGDHEIAKLIAGQINNDFTDARNFLMLSEQHMSRLTTLRNLITEYERIRSEAIQSIKGQANLIEDTGDLIERFSDEPAYAEAIQLYYSADFELADRKQQLDEFLASKAVTQDYLAKNIIGEWIGANIALAWARAINRTLRIWAHTERKINSREIYVRDLYISTSTDPLPPIDIIHTWNGTHYERLIIRPAPSNNVTNRYRQFSPTVSAGGEVIPEKAASKPEIEEKLALHCLGQ